MNGPEHFRRAEELLDQAAEPRTWRSVTEAGPFRFDAAGRVEERVELVALAQVHATLAQAAATALLGVTSNTAAASHPVNQLAHDEETVIAVNDWHEAAARRSS